jgi:hypothetical protein
MQPLTPQQRTLRARIAAYRMHSEGKTNTGPASAAFLRRFEREVDPDGSLTAAERARRAEWALKAHMAALSLKASQTRARKNPRAVEKPRGFIGGRRVAVDDPRAA